MWALESWRRPLLGGRRARVEALGLERSGWLAREGTPASGRARSAISPESAAGHTLERDARIFSSRCADNLVGSPELIRRTGGAVSPLAAGLRSVRVAAGMPRSGDAQRVPVDRVGQPIPCLPGGASC